MSAVLTRRQFAAGIATLAFVRTTYPCSDKSPPWAIQLRTDLERMARDLTAQVRPWKGPSLVVNVESVGISATQAIQAAIDSVAQRGGGTVRLVGGDYISGTLDLRSNIRLEITRFARLLGSVDLQEYPQRVAKRPTVMDSNMGMNQSLIFAEGCKNISLSGEGVIHGRGDQQNFPGAESSGGIPGRPFLIRVIDCEGVHVKGLRLRDSPSWMQNYLNCEDVLIEDLDVENQANFNNDGLDIDGCRRVIVRNCVINSEDDALCFKGASQRPMEQVLVENCKLYSSCTALKFGTDSQGDFRNVFVRNIEVGGPAREMRSLNRRRADSGISWEAVDGNTGSYFMGLEDKPIEDVVIRDSRLRVGATHETVPAEEAVPEYRADYPDAHMIGKVAPAYGLWARHVNNLTLEKVAFTPDSPDARPAVIAKDACVS